ncbi:type VI secretion system baseplate subunit TssG [Cedecea sp.]|jgi:type VI secretion system protein ImpH|uniref:type VI secretion system baseplate subunit TssG n=1 Tax=Cedecea sp. TaxID=1970739 RepID=UPI0012AD6920|nr:type VI secretion system baseplate subunit TssG [Enterobacteriaceae bacterium RIT693]
MIFRNATLSPAPGYRLLKAKSPAVAFPGLSNQLNFFELLRRLERDGRLGVRPGSARERQVIGLEVIQPADLAFAPREVVSVTQRPARNAEPPSLVVVCRHFGMFAPYGPLPIHVTEHARQEMLTLNNRAFQEFIALLSQRLAVWHYRAWAQTNVALGHERQRENAFLHRINQLSGVCDTGAGNIHVKRLRSRFAGAWLPGRTGWATLQQMLQHYFAVPITIQGRHPRWMLGDEARQRMGKLGQTRLGRRFYDTEHAARITLGPLGPPDYLCWQSGSERLAALLAICRDYAGQQILFDVDLHIINRPDMSSRLGQTRLSRDGWLKAESSTYKQNVFQQSC